MNRLSAKLPRAILSSVLLLSTIPSAAQDAGRLENLFSAIDRNSDGVITAIEAPRRVEIIRSADADKSGGVTLAELRIWVLANARPKADPDAKTEILVADSFPENAPVSLAQCEAAAEYSASKNGYTFLVMSGKSGEILYERYDQGWNPERPYRLASGTKSFSGAMLAAAVMDKLLTLDEPVSETIHEWKGDDRLAKITIRQLLSLTSRIAPGNNGAVPTYQDAVTSAAPNPNKRKKFAYGPDAFQIFGELMTRKLAARDDLPFADPLAYLDERIFRPIGMKYADWRRGGDGMPRLPSGASLTAREWAKFGKLIFDKGNANGSQLFDPAAFAECLKGSAANPAYGITFWLLNAKPKAPATLSGAYMAAGMGKQRLYIIPKKNLIVVRQGESIRYDDIQCLAPLLN